MDLHISLIEFSIKYLKFKLINRPFKRISQEFLVADVYPNKSLV